MPRPRLDRPVYRLKREPSGLYLITWSARAESGRAVSKSVSTRTRDEAEARRYLAQWVAGLEATPQPQVPLVRDLVAAYLADRKSVVVDHERLANAAKALCRHVGDLEPGHLGPKTYWHARRRDGAAPGTIRKEGVTLRAAFAWGVRHRWLTHAPAVDLPPSPAPRERWLTREEAARLVAACHAPHVRLFVVLALNTASRKTALLTLRWEQVDFASRTISLNPAGRAQTRKRRSVVPINTPLLAELQAAAVVRTTDFVIEYEGAAPVGAIKHAFNRAVERAQIPRCTPHDLRRTAASWMAQAGVPLEEVALVLGDTFAVVERVYARFSPDYLRRAVKALEGAGGVELVSEQRKERK